jgi:hypothetical protein
VKAYPATLSEMHKSASEFKVTTSGGKIIEAAVFHLQGETKADKSNSKKKKKTKKDRETSPPSPCKYCKGDHWNNTCPNRTTESSTTSSDTKPAATSPATVAAPNKAQTT